MRIDHVPQGVTIIAFLKSRGWKEKNRDQYACTLIPPHELSLPFNFEYKVPMNDSLIDYREYALRIVFSIADLYELNKWELLELLSQSIEDIQKDIVLRQELVAHAM